MGHFHREAGGQRERQDTVSGNDGLLRVLHSHTWFVGVGGVVVGLLLLVFAPRLAAVSRSLFLFAGFHLLGAVVLLSSFYALASRGHRHRDRRSSAGAREFDFGWGPEWMNGLGLAALIALFLAVAVEIAAPAWWPPALLLSVAGTLFLIGNFVMRSFRSRDHVVLPMVDLLRGERDTVLDAGCGAGRTTVAISRMLRSGSVVAVDRFDAGYIEGGGRALLDRNLAAAGLTERVGVERADLASLPFDDATFDSAVSTNVFDHLGAAKGRALAEVYRTLKPGGRFLLAVWVPSWEMFTVANILSFFLTSRGAWRRLATATGFRVIDEGVFNYAWFVLLAKPGVETSP